MADRRAEVLCMYCVEKYHANCGCKNSWLHTLSIEPLPKKKEHVEAMDQMHKDKEPFVYEKVTVQISMHAMER